jgi:cation diffusion facilitator CzcD-associated flavoprotein CzcO
VVVEFGCNSYIHREKECTAAQWLEDELLWGVSLRDTKSQKDYIQHAHLLITAVGFCDIPRGASDINGLENFQAHIFHSANWDHSFDFKNKDVVVVGNGCSANQFIPYLVREASIRGLTQVVRSPHWVAPKVDSRTSSWQKW